MNNEKTLVILDPVLKKGFTSVPNIVLFANNLSMPAKCLYSILLSFAWQNDECWPGQTKLASACSCNINTVGKYLKELRECSLISWKRQGLNRPNIYYINDLSHFKPPETLKTADSQERVNPDSQGFVTLDSQERVDKEYSINNVVVDPCANEKNSNRKKITNNKTASSTVENDGAAFDLPAATGTQGIDYQDAEIQADRDEKGPEEKMPAWEQIRAHVREVADALISVGFAKEIEKNYPLEKVSTAIEEMRSQIERGIIIKRAGAWLRYALGNDIQPDQPAKTKTIPKGNGDNNRTPRGKAQNESSYSEKEKEFIRSLYVKSAGGNYNTPEKKEKKKALIRSLCK